LPVHDLIWCVALGGFISALPNAVFIVASRHLVAAELTLFMLLEFALGPIWVWLFLNEIPGARTIFWGFLVIAAVLLRVMFELRKSR
jgi:drug/metabolite transporter (DMT)-like permease